MKSIKIDLDLPLNPYSIHLYNSWQGLIEVIKPFVGKNVMLVSDENVKQFFVHDVAKILTSIGCKISLAIIPSGEKSKSLWMAEKLYTQALNDNLDRSSSIIALGGGIVGDLAGFVASTYMRGINFIQIPTTLLAQVDSSVGGKVAVNHSLAKNIIGSFYQPKCVYINVNTLSTLPPREFSTGMAEVIKYGFIWDDQFIRWIEENIESIMKKQMDTLIHTIERCCQIKAEIVSQDEREKGLRAILNFGHTVGHGLESITSYNYYTHGEAVGLGMIYESLIAHNMGLVDESLVHLLIRLLEKAGLPTRIQEINVEDLIIAMGRDKKNKSGSIAFLLPVDFGKVEIFNNIDMNLIYKVYEVLKLA